MTRNTEVVVIGGGYAGVIAANRLTQRDDVAVTVINPRPHFVDRIRLHQHVGGTHDAVVEYHDVVADGIRLVVDTVTRINASERSVILAGGRTIGYDYLIYAVGSASTDPTVPGAAQYAYPIATLEAAQRLRQALDAAPSEAAVTVVGAGLTGIETAAELAEQGRRVTLVCGDELGPTLHPRGRRSVANRLTRLGVRLLDGDDATVTAVTRAAVQLSGGETLPSSVTIWTAGFRVPDLAARSGLSTDSADRLITDETLTSIDDPHIVAAGDSAAPSDLPHRMSCQAAIQLGPRAADTVLARIAGEQPAKLNVLFAGQCISLGRRAGIFQFSTKDDTARSTYLAGRPGAKIKEFICRGILDQLTDEGRKPGSGDWAVVKRLIKDGKRERRLAADLSKSPITAAGRTSPSAAPDRAG